MNMGLKNFSRAELESDGFVGWIRFDEIRSTDLCPQSGGIYLVIYGGGNPEIFPDRNIGGWFEGKNPTVSDTVLAANWVDDAEVVYFGKANNLRRRLREYADFGAGRPVGHRGGRLIWQLPKIEALRVAWKETPQQDPQAVETEMIGRFRQCYGKPPFANYPHRLRR